MATTLKDVTRLIRSKNAGAFQLTFDIMFDDEQTYRRVRDANVITKPLIRSLYGTPEEDILIVNYDAAQAIKITIPRPVSCGDLGERDIFGGQQYAPLMDIEI
ncbi:MAG TPA: DUF4387 domain-containing protein [Thermodesulfobacteriota bacterium]